METKITKNNIDWKSINNSCRNTISLKESDKEPSSEWKKKLLIAQHSPIRKGTVEFRWDEIPYAISTHFARHHEGIEKFISTSREDRTGIKRENRSQMEMVSMDVIANIQAIINISEKRLCNCADSTTIKYWKSFLSELEKIEPEVFWACVPSCVRCGGCIETFGGCRFYEDFSKDFTSEEHTDITKRYDAYQRVRKR